MTRAQRAAVDEAHASHPTAYWDEVARAHGSRVAPLWRLHADLATRALLARWLPAGRPRRLLKTDLYDEACSEGLVPVLAERAQQVIGLDVSPVVAAAASMRAPARATAGVSSPVARTSAGGPPVAAVAGDVRSLPFRAASFDVVVSNSTLDHFTDHAQIARALRELERVLVADGLLILTLDNLAHPLVRVRNALSPLLRRLGVVPYAVGATHGRDGLRRALDASGFRVLELTAVHHFPRLALDAFERVAGRAGQRPALRLACSAERLGGWPTRWWTGQYVAALARPRRGADALAER